EDNELYLQVPSIVRGGLNGQPETDHGSGVLLVASDSDVLLQWQEAASTGLQRDSFSSEYQRYVVGERPRKPLAYRFQSGGSSPPAWAGMARMLPQQITLEQHVDLDVVASQLAIRQNFELQVANEPLSELRFAVRKDVADVQPPQVYVNGNLVSSTPLETISESSLQALQRPIVGPLPDTPTPNSPSNSGVQADEAPTSDGATWQTYQLIGNHPQFLGATRLTILSNQLWKAGEKSSGGEEAGTTLSVPLAQLLLPGEARHLRQDWTLRTDLEVEAVHSAESGFSQDTLVGGLRIRPLAEKQREIQLSLRPRRMLGMPPVRIGKSWLQTFVTGRTRRDRFVVQVETSSDELQLKLPEKANIREKKVMVSVDGFEQPYHYEPSTDIVTIALPSSGRGEHVIEISYLLPDALTWVSKLTVAPPQILGAEQIEKFYWQLLTPSVQHLGWSPTELTAEWTWDWAGLWWKRDSLWDQRRLEAWIGTEVQESPPASANSYVMSGRGPDKAVNVWVLSRFVLWFPVGAFAIALSFTVLNFPPVRRPIFVFALAGVIAGLAMVWPDMAMLAGQTAVLSLGLVALVWVVQAAVDSRVRRRSVFTTRPSSTFMERSDYYSGSRGARTPQPTVTHVGSSIGGSAE
ncbi:MAG: hypothetical protein KDA45_11640, partial [Planctomycetales bacterium]|nr:hypothetical protein [Planctomycetales bacterium]